MICYYVGNTPHRVWNPVCICSITDAANETKDKVKYLEALRRHFEHLYHSASPADIMNTALPGLASSVKQMDSISRFYARSGYLGLLFTKVGREKEGWFAGLALAIENV